MNKQNSKMFSLMFNFGITLVLLLVTVFAFLSVHYGWFAENRTVKGTGMNISIDYDDTVAIYYAYKYDTVRELGSMYSKIYDESTQTSYTQMNTISNLELLSYDMIFLERNANNPVIFRIDVTGEKVHQAGTVTIKLKRSTPDGSSMDSLVLTNSENKKFAYISSCVYFKASALSTLQSYFGTDDEPQNELWKRGITEFEGVSDTKRFVTANIEGNTRTYTKVDELVFEVPYTASDWVGDTLSVFIYMDYDPTYVDYAYQDSNKNVQSGELSEISLDLLNDFVMISSIHD